MAGFKLLLPAMGEGIIEATITRWLVSRGQQIRVDQPLVEIATDKVDSEIPSPVEGTITRLLYREGETPKVGEVIAVIETAAALKDHPDLPINGSVLHQTGVPDSEPVRSKKVFQRYGHDSPHVTPLIRSIARQKGIAADELITIEGTGEKGLITTEDLNGFIIRKAVTDGQTVEQTKPEASVDKTASEVALNEGDRVVEMSRMRKLIANHMVSSVQTSPHVTSFLEADITGLVMWRNKNKNTFERQFNVRLTFTPVFTEVVAACLAEYPGINVSVNGESIIYRKNIHIGIATALPDGNLIVPVVRNADRENLSGLAEKISDLAVRARNNALLPDEIKGGTFTITNIGQYNNLTGTPIINQPQSAILAFGTIMKKPWAVKTPDGYGIAVRDIIMLSLTYDHRVIDGALGGSFLSSVAKRLENFSI